MLIRMKTGRRAGEVCEMKFADGRELVDSGRAVQIDDAGRTRSAAPSGVAVAQPVPAKPAVEKKKKRGK